MDPYDQDEVERVPEYDMEFASYGPNAFDMPLSPPSTPPAVVPRELPRREMSPFSEASSMTSVNSTDSMSYYREEGGRMFAAMPDVPVVLPVDHAEMRRLAGQYELIRLVTGNNHYEEINELLNPPYESSIRVLDVVSNSPWIDEMAVEYPHVKFTGCNFVPTRHPHHENIQLEVYNLNDGLRGRDESYDLIHACSCFKGARDFNAWLKEMKRLLKPGGILITIDLEMAVWMRDGSDPWRSVPTICSYTERVHNSLQEQGIELAYMPLIGTWLREMGGFSEVEDTVTSIPVGPWDDDEIQREIGTMARDNIMSALYSTHPLWLRAGKSLEEVEEIVAKARAELYNPNAELFERVFYVFARKEEVPYVEDY